MNPSIIYCEGCYLPATVPCLPVSDRGLLFGDGAYATLQVADGIPLFLETHLTRLQAQCSSLGLHMPPLDPLEIRELIVRNCAEEGIWRLKILVTGGDAPDYRLPSNRSGRIIMTLNCPPPLLSHPLRLGVFSKPLSVCHAHFKSLAHLNRFYVMEEALVRGWDDNITLTPDQLVLEAAFGNLFWVQGVKVYTPSPTLPLYFGVTIGCVLTCAQEMGYHVHYVTLPYCELPQDAHYFRTNTMGGIRPIAQIDTQLFSINQELHALLETAYHAKIEEQKKAALWAPLMESLPLV